MKILWIYVDEPDFTLALRQALRIKDSKRLRQLTLISKYTVAPKFHIFECSVIISRVTYPPAIPRHG